MSVGDKPRKCGSGHSIADHALGALVAHIHAPGEAHDHDHDHDGMDLLPGGTSDAVVLTSIGIDIGSSGTQVAFAQLALERTDDRGGAEVARLEARRRETIHQSPIYLTPFRDGHQIDADQLARLIDHAFEGAGLTADAVDCGVVILTGAARERVNAEPIGRLIAERCGDIVSASAGHHMEARLAAMGSGAAVRSAEFGQSFLNIDIGGATTKLAICEGGSVIATAALAIGGRLVATDAQDRIVRLEPGGCAHAERAGFAWEKGGLAPWSERQEVGRRMAEMLVAELAGKLTALEREALYLTPPLASMKGIDAIIFSGGVGEYVYGRETRSFGDLGLPLGRALAMHVDSGRLPWPLMPATECIRATVLGASSYSVQLSGRTGCISNPGALLPARNLPVAKPALRLCDKIDSAAVARAIEDGLAGIDLDAAGRTDCTAPVLAIAWQGEPAHERLQALAQGVKRGFSARIANGLPLYVLVDGDIAASLGAILRDELGVAIDILVLDGLQLAELDFVDLGRIRLPSGTVPVTIKSLVFRDERGQIPRHSGRRRRSA